MFNPDKDLIRLGVLKKEKTKQEESAGKLTEHNEIVTERNSDQKSFSEAKATQEKADQEALGKLREKFKDPEKKKEIIEVYGEKRAGTLKKATDLGVKIIPVIGEASMIIDGTTGKNRITGEKLSGKERVFNVAVGTGCLVLDFIPIAGEAGEVARIGMVLGKGARIGKTAEKGIVAGRSIKGMEGLAKLSAKSKKGEKFSDFFQKTAKYMEKFKNKNPELFKKMEETADSRIKKYLTENNPTKKRLEELEKDPRIGSLLERVGETENAEHSSEPIRKKIIDFLKKPKQEPLPEEGMENIEKKKAA